MAHPSRRRFLHSLGAGAAASLVGAPWLHSCGLSGTTAAAAPDATDGRPPLRLAPSLTPAGITLTAAPGTADHGSTSAPAWLINGSLPSPTLRIRRGDRFQVEMRNQLPQDLILHWHGWSPPALMDGHPRLAVAPGGRYAYDFTVSEQPGTYWYHSHTHMRTGEQTYRGIAGLLLVSDPAEETLHLPTGTRELPLILQDRRLDAAGTPVYSPVGPAMMAGVQGSAPFVNGVHQPFLDAETALYRLRLLNGANARVMRLARSDGEPLVLIGGDGGFLPAPLALPFIDLAPAERADVLLDLRGRRAGDRVMLRSVEFAIPGTMGFMGGMNRQGQALDLLEFRITRQVNDPAVIPTRLPAPMLPDAEDAVRERRFRFDSMMMSHTINGRAFEMDRMDVTVPFGETELWTFENPSAFPHPVHLHATHFRVLSRTGGRGAVQPWETGAKDTVLLWPQETVQVVVRFTRERGRFLMHCHNLEHEDMGMMANVEVT